MAKGKEKRKTSKQRACPLRIALAELGHPQPTAGTPVYNDNSTTTGILNSTMRQKLSKAFDMKVSYGEKEALIWRTISQNTTHHGTTKS